MPEENRNRTGQHAIEDGPPSEAIPSRLQAKVRVKKRLQDGGAAVGAPRAAAVDYAARTRFGVALVQQEAAEIVLDEPARSSGEGEERSAAAAAHEILPRGDVGDGGGVEAGGIGDGDVEVVPRVLLDEEARDVTHRRHVDAAGAPVGDRQAAAEVPRDAAERDEVIPAVGFLEKRLIDHPVQQHLAGAVALLHRRVLREDGFLDRQPEVERYVERLGGIRRRRAAAVVQHPVVVDELQRELIGPEPRAAHVRRHDSWNPGGGGFAETGVGEGVAAGGPRVYAVAVFHYFGVELRRQVVNVEFPIRAARRRIMNYIGGGGGGWGGEAGWIGVVIWDDVDVVVVEGGGGGGAGGGGGDGEGEGRCGEEEEELEEEDGDEEPCAAVVEGDVGFEGGEIGGVFAV